MEENKNLLEGLEKFDIRGVEQGTNLPRQISDIEQDQLLRPITFDAFKGQPAVVENLRVFVQAAKMRARLLITCCYTVLPALGKRPSHKS